jgi:hypothetical protein
MKHHCPGNHLEPVFEIDRKETVFVTRCTVLLKPVGVEQRSRLTREKRQTP